jgi:hypothetical protein
MCLFGPSGNRITVSYSHSICHNNQDFDRFYNLSMTLLHASRQEVVIQIDEELNSCNVDGINIPCDLEKQFHKLYEHLGICHNNYLQLWEYISLQTAYFQDCNDIFRDMMEGITERLYVYYLNTFDQQRKQYLLENPDKIQDEAYYKADKELVQQVIIYNGNKQNAKLLTNLIKKEWKNDLNFMSTLVDALPEHARSLYSFSGHEIRSNKTFVNNVLKQGVQLSYNDVPYEIGNDPEFKTRLHHSEACLSQEY